MEIKWRQGVAKQKQMGNPFGINNGPNSFNIGLYETSYENHLKNINCALVIHLYVTDFSINSILFLL